MNAITCVLFMAVSHYRDLDIVLYSLPYGHKYGTDLMQFRTQEFESSEHAYT